MWDILSYFGLVDMTCSSHCTFTFGDFNFNLCILWFLSFCFIHKCWLEVGLLPYYTSLLYFLYCYELEDGYFGLWLMLLWFDICSIVKEFWRSDWEKDDYILDWNGLVVSSTFQYVYDLLVVLLGIFVLLLNDFLWRFWIFKTNCF